MAALTSHLPYTEQENTWITTNNRYGNERRGPLALVWEANCDPISDDYTPSEITADELLGEWISYLRRHEKQLDQISIYWLISPHWETAPFQRGELFDRDFLSYWSWPVHTVTGQWVNFNRIPVEDKLWRPGRGDKGGFIQEATGWKPAHFQRFMDVPQVLSAAGRVGMRHTADGMWI